MPPADDYLVDSNILLRIPRRDDSDHALVAGAVANLNNIFTKFGRPHSPPRTPELEKLCAYYWLTGGT
jgi:hypothetical protein